MGKVWSVGDPYSFEDGVTRVALVSHPVDPNGVITDSMTCERISPAYAWYLGYFDFYHAYYKAMAKLAGRGTLVLIRHDRGLGDSLGYITV